MDATSGSAAFLVDPYSVGARYLRDARGHLTGARPASPETRKLNCNTSQ